MMKTLVSGYVFFREELHLKCATFSAVPILNSGWFLCGCKNKGGKKMENNNSIVQLRVIKK